MSIILGALGGAGAEMASMGSTMMKADLALENDSKLAGVRSGLELEREKTMAEFRQSLANAPLNRLTAKAQQFAGQPVQQEAGPVTLSGYDPQAAEAGPTMPGFEGDPGIVRRAIEKLPEGPEKQAALAQLERQVGADTEFQNSIVKGKTRSRTSEESLNAAVDDAKANDLPAYAEYEAKIGKPKRDEKRIEVAERRDDARAMAAATSEERKAMADARRYEVDLKRLELQGGTLEATNRKIDAWIQNEAEKRENDEAKANNPKASSERLYSIVNAMNATIKLLNDSGKGSTPEAKKDWQAQYDTAVQVRSRAQSALNETLTARGVPEVPSPTAPPAATPSTRPPLSNFLK